MSLQKAGENLVHPENFYSIKETSLPGPGGPLILRWVSLTWWATGQLNEDDRGPVDAYPSKQPLSLFGILVWNHGHKRGKAPEMKPSQGRLTSQNCVLGTIHSCMALM